MIINNHLFHNKQTIRLPLPICSIYCGYLHLLFALLKELPISKTRIVIHSAHILLSTDPAIIMVINKNKPIKPHYSPAAICFLLHTLTITHSLTASSTTGPNNLYSNAGVATFDTSPYVNNSTTTLNPALFTISFVRSQSSTNFRFGCSINSITYQIINNKLNYTILPTGTNTSASAQIAFYTNNANKITVLKIAYMTVEPLFGSYYFSYRMLAPKRNFIQNTASTYSQTSSTDGPFNTSKTYNLWITILGVDASMATNNEIDLYPSASVAGANSISYVIQTISPIGFYLTSIVIMAFIYNNTELQALQRSASMTKGSFGNTYSSSLSATDAANSVRSYNTLAGIVGYHIVSLPFYQFTTTITPNNTVSFSSSYTYSYVSFNYLIATFTACAPSTPFLIVSTTKTCYDVCPIRYSTDNLYFECNSCPYDCYECNAQGACTECSADIDFRQLNASNRCVPLDGYYDNGNSTQAIACDAVACLTCNSAIYCLSCQSGKYLTASNTCAACINECTSCTSASSCSQCNTGYTYSASNNSCFLNCSAITNCLTCNYSSSLVCNSCANGYQLLNNTCKSVCGDGNRAPNQLCDDGNTQNNDGCSSSCTVELHFFCADTQNGSKVLSVCEACSSNCDNCVNSTYCSNCSTNYSQSISGSTSQCIQSCVPNCNTCDGSRCSSCNPGFTLVTSQLCSPVCGDGYVYNSEVCDDGNSVNGDGCNSTCQVEQNSNCTTTNNTSVCSLLSLSITLQSIKKDDFTNTVFMVYSLSQYNYSAFKTANWSAIITQQSNLQLSLSSISFDSSTNNILISLPYQSILSNRQLALKFAFPNSPPFNYLGNIIVSSTITAANNLSLWAYQDSDYYIVYILNYVTFGLTMFALLFFAVGYYAGKLIALQLLSIYQLTYYCLLSVENMAPGFVTFRQFRYSNGYSLNFFGRSTAISSPLFSYLNYDHILANNFNLNCALIFAPLLLALLSAIFSVCQSSSKSGGSQRTSSQFLRGQCVYYGLMCVEYSLLVPLLSIANEISQLALTQIGFMLLGVAMLLLIIMYNCLITKFPKYFHQFIQSFASTKSIHFYYFLQLEKLINACLLVFLSSWKHQLFTILALQTVKLFAIICKKPYKAQGGNFRPFLNCITQLAITVIFCLYNLIGNSSYQFHYYAPFFIVGHIFVAVLYNLYFFAKCVKKKCSQRSSESKVGEINPIEDRNPWKYMWQYSKQLQSTPKVV